MRGKPWRSGWEQGEVGKVLRAVFAWEDCTCMVPLVSNVWMSLAGSRLEPVDVIISRPGCEFIIVAYWQ